MSNRDMPHNPPAAAMMEPAPKQDRAIRTRLDAAVDATFPASDPVALEDPERRHEPVLPADAQPGDVLGEPHHRSPAAAATRRMGVEPADMLRWIWPWALAGIALQIWWINRRR